MFISDGFEFFESENGVVLCAGDKKGFLPPKYFEKVVQTKKGRKEEAEQFLIRTNSLPHIATIRAVFFLYILWITDVEVCV